MISLFLCHKYLLNLKKKTPDIKEAILLEVVAFSHHDNYDINWKMIIYKIHKICVDIH